MGLNSEHKQKKFHNLMQAELRGYIATLKVNSSFGVTPTKCVNIAQYYA